MGKNECSSGDVRKKRINYGKKTYNILKLKNEKRFCPTGGF